MAACSAKLIAVSWATCLKEQLQVIITIQKLVGGEIQPVQKETQKLKSVQNRKSTVKLTLINIL